MCSLSCRPQPEGSDNRSGTWYLRPVDPLIEEPVDPSVAARSIALVMCFWTMALNDSVEAGLSPWLATKSCIIAMNGLSRSSRCTSSNATSAVRKRLLDKLHSGKRLRCAAKSNAVPSRVARHHWVRCRNCFFPLCACVAAPRIRCNPFASRRSRLLQKQPCGKFRETF